MVSFFTCAPFTSIPANAETTATPPTGPATKAAALTFAPKVTKVFARRIHRTPRWGAGHAAIFGYTKAPSTLWLLWYAVPFAMSDILPTLLWRGPVRTTIQLLMKRLSPPLLFLKFLLTGALAQDRSARAYYEEAKHAGALPSLPYVCFRTSGEISLAPGKEVPYNDPTFAMLGTSGQIADIIESKSLDQMSAADRERVQQLREREWLYVNGFDHGVDGGSHLFNRKNSNDPSRADWVFEGTAGSQNQQLTWDFNINWGTLRFRETLTIGSDSMTYYGQCEAVSK